MHATIEDADGSCHTSLGHITTDSCICVSRAMCST
jgi:hypothetical protein